MLLPDLNEVNENDDGVDEKCDTTSMPIFLWKINFYVKSVCCIKYF